MRPESLERRCPRLGGEVTFGYCKGCSADQTPCFKIFDCWWERFDVVAHMQGCLSPDAFNALSQNRTPPDKMTSLVELIHQAQVRAARD